MRSRVVKGNGWHIFTEGDSAWIKFVEKPDPRTLMRLRKVAAWDMVEKAWRSWADWAITLENIGRQSHPAEPDDNDYCSF